MRKLLERLWTRDDNEEARYCAGWVGCHDMDNSLALRFESMAMDNETLDAFLNYRTEVPLFASGAEAAEHGMAEVAAPGPKAAKVIDLLVRKGKGHR